MPVLISNTPYTLQMKVVVSYFYMEKTKRMLEEKSFIFLYFEICDLEVNQ